MSETVLGNAEILYVWDGTSAYEPIACLTSNGLSESVSEVSSVTKCNPQQTVRKAGTHSYEISFEGEYIKTEAGKASWVELKAKLRALNNVTWKIATTYEDDTEDIEYGNAFFSDLEKTAPAGDENITFSGTLMGSGVITSTDPNA
jgi:hypothetical protein